MAKGIRVNLLAKELGVESKQILAKLREEGLGDHAPNHMSTLSVGLAESVREWFSGSQGGGGGTAVETAAPVETKKKTSRAKAKTIGAVATAEIEPTGGDSDPAHSTAATEPAAPTHAGQGGNATVHPAVVSNPETSDPAPAPANDAGAVHTGAVHTGAVHTGAVHTGVVQTPTVNTGAVHTETVSTPTVPTETDALDTAAAANSSSARDDTHHGTAPAPHAPVTSHPAHPSGGNAPASPAASAPAVPPSAIAAGPTSLKPSPAAPAGGTHTHAPHTNAPHGNAPHTNAPHTNVPHGNAPHAGPVTRPTVTIASRMAAPQRPVAERKPVEVAPQLSQLEPAKISGPRIVRVEKEEVVDTRGPRRPGMAGQGPPSGLPNAIARGGRGVKVGEDDEEEARKKAAAKKSNSNSSRRRGVDGRRGEAMEKLREFTNADLLERQERLTNATGYTTGVSQHLTKTQNRGQHAQARTIVQKGEPVEIQEPISVKSLAAALGVKSGDIIKKLMKQGVFATVNQGLDADTAQAMAMELGIELNIVEEASLEDELLVELGERTVDASHLVIRPPVVTILGHVDHGKTSLLDKIRNANVAAGEAGGITQHTAAWQVRFGEGENAKRVTFIDTPGHQAFTSMRARGANMTDVVVLVVSAAEGVQPQTIESINHARAAKVPIVVAMNKIDRADANPDMIMGQLAKEGLNPVEWGGDVEFIRTSAVTGQGIPELIEILDLQSQLMELKTDPTAPARGTVIESRIDEGLGSVATVLIQDGTLRVGDTGLCGAGYGRIRSLLNDRGEQIQEATASTPVIVSGLSVLPSAGDKFYALDDLERARSIAEERASLTRHAHLAGQGRVTADNLFATMKAGEIRTINLIIKADVQGSVETLTKTVTDSNTDEVRVKVIHSGAGAISESDVELAMATRASFDDPKKDKVAIIGFHVVPDESARALAEQNRIDVKLYRVIYEIFDDLKKALSGMLTPEVREKLHGHAEIRNVIRSSKIGSIAGCMVTDGHIQRGSRIRLIRDGVVITEDLAIDSLRRFKEDAKEVKSGFECGIKLAGYDDIKQGDVLEAYIREEFERTL